MSGLFQRVKNAFKRNPSSENIPTNSTIDFDNEEIDDTNTRQPYRQNEDLDDMNDEMENVTYNNRSQLTNLRQQQRETIPSDENSQPSLLNTRNTNLRKKPNDFQSGQSHTNVMNRNVNSSVNNNVVPITNSTIQERLPFQSQNQDLSSRPSQQQTMPQAPINNLSPGQNHQQSSIPSTNQILQSSLRNNFLSAMNRNRRPFQINRNSTLIGFPRDLNTRLHNSSYSFNRPFFSNQLNRSFFKNRLLPFQADRQISNYKFDYPIENVFIDKNIPSSIAIKINEAVEYDRFGNMYHNHHYAYEPTIQHMNFDNNQQIDRHIIGNSHPKGIRYIREIHNDSSFNRRNYNCYPQEIDDEIFQKQNYNNLQLMIDCIPEINYQTISSQDNFNYYPMPIKHYIACALPYDPMRIE
ncbi:unnamed protein product [Rotaria sp. Silwood1]|nr:unnamed protein product [Rotaria sp. Silwood1]CAF3668513.1 unnamed protein product [Rotaria sp. Silwood1]CAF3691112.1 unnamed protein product [Rotaria sp. Silwood1]CAF4940836.1 unnamed protein product [Rotaria sp. Silwood1]